MAEKNYKRDLVDLILAEFEFSTSSNYLFTVSNNMILTPSCQGASS
jgi:ABC-type enterochelin transport system permease subunit